MKNKCQRPNTRGGVYIPRESDKEQIQEYYEDLSTVDKKELVASYNQQNNIWGVRAQMVYLSVLHTVFMERFGKSPFIVENDVAYKLGPKIYYSEELDTILPLPEN